MLNRAPEPRRSEASGFGSRFKVGLETPLRGRFVGENKKLIFAPPHWYEVLVRVCIIGGIVASLLSFLGIIFQAEGYGFVRWVGLAVAAAGIWAYLSNERLVCDLVNRNYLRREGRGAFQRQSKGSLNELDALVLLAGHGLPGKFMGPLVPVNLVTYRLVLHWKGSRHPLLVVEQFDVDLPNGAPINHRAGHLVTLGSRYAASLQIPFFDNSYFISPDPLAPI